MSIQFGKSSNCPGRCSDCALTRFCKTYVLSRHQFTNSSWSSSDWEGLFPTNRGEQAIPRLPASSKITHFLPSMPKRTQEERFGLNLKKLAKGTLTWEKE